LGEFPSFLPNWFKKTEDTTETPKTTNESAAMWTNRTAGVEVGTAAAEDQPSAPPLSPNRFLDKQKSSSKARTPRGQGAKGGIHALDDAGGGDVRPASTEGGNELFGIGL
jgi:hypothetical protein